MTDILLIDDDRELTELLSEVLTLEGFTVHTAHNGEDGLSCLQQRHIDMILLDVMMPKLNGMETLKRIRDGGDTPVLMLTAKGEEIDRVMGLELGADDYLAKPFSERELLARIRAILRRAHQPPQASYSDILSYVDLQLFPGKLEAYCQGQLLDLTGTEFAMLHHFVQHPGQVLTKEELSLHVLGKRLARFDRAVDMHVSNVRKKVPDWEDGKPRIKTLRGKGYLLTQGDG